MIRLERSGVLEGLRLIGIDEPERAIRIVMRPTDIVVTYCENRLNDDEELVTFDRHYSIVGY